MANSNKPTVQARNTMVMAGVDKHLPSPVVLGGITYTPATLKGVFQEESDAMNASNVGHKQWLQQVQDEQAARTKAEAVLKLLRAYLISHYGANAVAILGDFGLTIPKPKATKTVATKAAALAKSKATRTARSTMGKKQKKAVKGAPAATAPATPAPAPSPTVPATTPVVGSSNPK